MSKEHLGVNEGVATSMLTLGVSNSVWQQLDTLSSAERVKRCRKSLAELERIPGADNVGIEKHTAQALLACCYSVAVAPDLQQDLTTALWDVAHADTERVALDYRRLTSLLKRTLQSWQ